jgi:hypothetical protein
LKGSDPSCTYTEEWFKENGRFSSNGVVIHKSGGFIWHLNHSWDQVEYDPDRELLLFIHSLPRSIRNSGSLLKEGNPVQKGLGMTHEEFQKKLCKDGIYIWPFDPTTRIWQEPEFLANFKRPGNTIGGRQESAMLEYIHDRKTLAFEGAYFSLILNRDSGEWVETKGSRGTTKFTGAYVPHLKKLVAFRGKKTQVRGVDDKRWTTVREDGPIVHTSFSAANYDPVSGKILLFNGGKKGPYLWAYDPINNAWENPPQKGDVPGSPINSQKMLIYQDHARNVMVFDSGKEVRVYRYKKQ